MKSVKINVTQEDIDNGVCKSVRHCPIARAIKRVFPTKDVLVGPHDIDVSDDNFANYKTYLLPEEAGVFVSKFDIEEAVSPFEFEMELTDD